MKALIRDRYGSPEVLRWEEIETPTPTGEQVLVGVVAASLNAADLDYLHGRPGVLRVVSGMRAPRNRRIGVDVAGRVEAVGESVTGLRIGDAVFSDLFNHGMGAFAEYVCAPDKAFLAVPPTMPMEDAATFPHAAVLALQATRAGRATREGERMLMNGASGNVGPFAIQIAKSYGMHVTGVCRTSKMDFVRSIGADDVLDYTAVDFARTGQTWDRIVDVAARHSLSRVRGALTTDGVYTWVGGTTGTLASALVFGSLMSLTGRKKLGFTFAWKPFHRPDVEALLDMYAAGRVRPVVERTMPLAEAIDAIRYMDDGKARGKIVLTA
jgi:NADPH:quinone reductase-like Zn-dependent oxidoreductase